MSDAAPSHLALEAAHLLRKLTGQRWRAQAAAKRAFAEALAALKPGDIAIDLGANAGEFTAPMAATGAQVYAFEPDPHAADLLRNKVAGFDNVTVIEAAAGTQDGQATLYRKKGFGSEPDRATKSSSLFSEKSNVTEADAVQIEICDFVAFLTGLGHDVALTKIDIEGAEVPLFEALLASGAAKRLRRVFVETHERSLPQLAARTAALKSALTVQTVPSVNWDWH